MRIPLMVDSSQLSPKLKKWWQDKYEDAGLDSYPPRRAVVTWRGQLWVIEKMTPKPDTNSYEFALLPE